MDTRRYISDEDTPEAHSVTFNQDNSCFSVGLDVGFSIYNSMVVQLVAHRDFQKGIVLAQMVDRTQYVALVGGGKHPKYPPNKLVIWNEKENKAAIQLDFASNIRNVKLSRRTLVVVLKNSIHIYKFSNPPEKVSTRETADNPAGLCCMTKRHLAFPGRSPGQVCLTELETNNLTIVPAHSSALSAITLSADGEVMATASETGTLIRIYATRNCAKIAELRRGVDHATIFSIAISPSAQQLAVTSDKGTLHVFDIPHPSKLSRTGKSQANTAYPATQDEWADARSPPADADADNNKWGILGRLPMLPKLFSDIYSFANAKFEPGDVGTRGFDPAPERTIQPHRGVIAWLSDRVLIVVSAGHGARWEKFEIAEKVGTSEEPKRHLYRTSWKQYMAGN